jgi:sugar lactone lactonase YvrE
MTVFSWGQIDGDNRLAHSLNVKSSQGSIVDGEVGRVTTIAGSGFAGSADGIGTNAQFSNANDVAIDSEGNVYVADSGNHRIRMISPSGLVSTLAGSGRGYADGVGTAAKFNFPIGLSVDKQGNVYCKSVSLPYDSQPSVITASVNLKIV